MDFQTLIEMPNDYALNEQQIFYFKLK